MSRLHFDYWMEISFTEPVVDCHYTIKCLPKDSDMQKISDLDIRVFPENAFQMGEDSFGNRTIYGNVKEQHTTFGFQVSGIAETWMSCGDFLKEEEYAGRFSYPYGLNKSGAGLSEYFASIDLTEADSAYDKGLLLMNSLHQEFNYEKEITNVNTTAEEAWTLKKGVCQDYAHILIALCHKAGIPARYVTGMMIGEGYSHAWVEILSDGVWYGLDPTNGCIAGSSYIKIGAGRDANDCVINKGIIRGGGMQTQEVKVLVEEIPAEV